MSITNRFLNLFIFLFVILSIGLETYIYWFHQLRPWQPSSSFGRIIFYYSFFTVLSNIMLGISCLILAIKPNCSGNLFNVIRLNGLVGVLITMIVYNLILRGIHQPPTLLLRFINESLHVVIPLLGVLSWLIYGPFFRINLKSTAYSFLSLVIYGIYIFTRGYYTGLYPYPFINVARVGYERLVITVIVIAILFFILVLSLNGTEYIRFKVVKVITKRRSS